MELILFRHGIAKDRSEDQEDATRPLTDEGRKRLDASMDGFRRLIGSSGKPLIWSSPLDRAAQTARVIADHLHVRDITYKPFIASGEFEEFVQSITGSDGDLLPDDTVLILVGHEPWLGDWCHQLCRTRLPFKKGAAACIRLSGGKDPTGTLQWFAQPRVLKRTSRARKG